jgi:hypothetical protein
MLILDLLDLIILYSIDLLYFAYGLFSQGPRVGPQCDHVTGCETFEGRGLVGGP